MPSAFCKVTTLCPSIDSIGIGGASRGLFTTEGKNPESFMMLSLGPMARSVEDCIAVLESWFSPEHLPFFPQMTQIPLSSDVVE